MDQEMLMKQAGNMGEMREREHSLYSQRLLAVADVLLVFFGFYMLIKYLESTRIGVVQYHLLGYDFFAHLLMFVLPVVLIILRRESMNDYGMQTGQLRDRKVRLIGRVAFLELALLWIVIGSYAMVIEGYKIYLLLPPKFFAEAWAAPSIYRNLIGWSLTLVFEIVFCGVGEEVFFRGYIQGRINNALGRPWKIFRVQTGWGLVVSSLLFGFGHGLGTYNPFSAAVLNRFCFDWTAAVITLFIGLILGLLRDYTKGIAAPALIHASVLVFCGAFELGA